MGRTTPSGCGHRKSGHRRVADFLASDGESSGDECYYTPSRYLEEMPAPDFLGDQSDLVEVMLELEEDSMVVRSVTPTSAAAAAAAAAVMWDSAESLGRSSPTASQIRRKFAWLMSPLRRHSLASMMAAEDEEEAAVVAAPSGACLTFGGGGLAPREARRIKARLERTRSGAQRALKGLRFISRTTVGAVPADAVDLWHKVEDRFAKLAKDGLLSRDDFGECIGMVDSKEFAKGLFDALARRRRQNLQCINKEELYDFWLQISDQSFDARLQIFFDMVDTNEDGRITRDEVQELIILSASANKLSKLKEQAQEYAALIMEELDPENLGYIELWQLEELLLQRDRYMNYSRAMSTGSGGQWSQNIAGGRVGGGGGGGGGPRPPRQPFTVRRSAAKLRVAARENWRRAWVVALWLAAMVALFVWKFMLYRRREAFQVMGYCLTTAKGAAETLKLNMALVLLPVCRNTLTWLRSTRARLFVPFDDNITFHKMIATAIVVGILLHAGNHLLCDFPRLINASPEKYALVAGDFGRSGPPTYGGLVSGVEGVTGVAMVILMSISFTLATHRFRKNGARLPFPLNRLTGFNAFWYSHHLLAVVYLLLLVHGYFMFLVHKWYQKTTWMYIAIPFLVYVGERTLRNFRSKAYSVKILKVSLLPGSVLTLTMSKPHGFRYRSGQYIFLQCPTISPFEWHPFSITSAPGDDYLSVHIRTSGDWTEELKHIFIENYFAPGPMGRTNLNRLGSVQQKSLPRLLVDGPYGAPAQDFRNYDVLLLVGLGIGATPFISILRDLLNNIKLEDELMDLVLETSRSDFSYNSHSFNSSGSGRKRPYRTSCAHFYWVTREPGSFEWFKGVMNEVAEMDKKGVIEMHNYLTSVYEERDARTTLLTMVQALNHAKTGVDIVSGTRVRTHFARPNWREVFSKLASKHPGARVGVFYCGTPTLSKELRKLSHDMSHKTTTRFHFHKEYF